MRSQRARRLHIAAAHWILFKIESIHESREDIFEVGIGEECDPVLRIDIGWAYLCTAGVLVHEGNGVVVALINVATANSKPSPASSSAKVLFTF